MENSEQKVIWTYNIWDQISLDKNARLLACTNDQHQTNIIDDSVWQSCIFEGLFFEWFKAHHAFGQYRISTKKYGIRN